VSNHDLGNLPTSQWRTSLGASVLLSSPAGSLRSITMSGAFPATGPCAVAMRAVARHRAEAGLLAAPTGVAATAGFLAPAGVPAWALETTQLGQPAYIQTNNKKQYATSVSANGVGASGPPRRRDSA